MIFLLERLKMGRVEEEKEEHHNPQLTKKRPVVYASIETNRMPYCLAVTSARAWIALIIWLPGTRHAQFVEHKLNELYRSLFSFMGRCSL
mmetsp:Transcript_23341/g.37346  ORF Transcript_23341/g.37346 Transcript_23341/m.37346 type:complete len:90 (+) Transcript_23341:2316-2585(+)